MDLPLEVLTPDILISTCAQECGSKCCDFYLNDFHARVNIEDYKQLAAHDLEEFVVWDHGDPQLAKQPGGACIFLEPTSKQCSIYPIRPLDCRNFPYFMEEETIPDHCLLYHRSSSELIQKQRALTHDIPPFDKTYEELTPTEREYIDNLQEQPSLLVDELFEEEYEHTTDTGYYSILVTHPKQLQEAKTVIGSYEQAFATKAISYQAVSILGMDDDFEYSYHILGMMRQPGASLPISVDSPPTVDDLQHLVNWSSANNYSQLLAGILMPTANYQQIQGEMDRFQN